MKAKGITLLLILICSVSVLQGQNTNQVISITGHEANWMNQQWDTLHPYHKLYDYDNSGKCIRYEYSRWANISNKWQQRRTQYLYEYNANGKLKNEQQEEWDTTLVVWKKQNKNEYYHNQNGNLDSVIWKTWDNNLQMYYAYSKYEYYYNAQNGVVEILSYSPFNGTWKIQLRNSFTYDSNNRLSIESHCFWDNATSQWQPVVGKIYYTYSTDGKLITKLDSSRVFTHLPLLPKNLITYTYDTAGFLIETLDKRWIDGNSEWVNNYLNTYTNNTNGTVHFFIQKEWSGNAWANTYREYYNYVPLTGISSRHTPEYKIFPNPTSEYIYIEINEPILEMSISDITGHIIKREKDIKGNKISMIDIPNGTYVISFTTKANTFTTRIVKW